MYKIAFTFLATLITLCVWGRDFTVVIDAGHGGKDPGAIGKHIQEKDINLKVAMLVGNAISKEYPDVKVVYTRSTDIYVTLPGRAQIANKANGDLFISIHTNATESKNACGTETFMLGLAKTNQNFEVAKRENSVMLLEDDKEVYQGFDPTSPDSYIMFELMQSTYIDLSIQLADYVQTEFAQAGRSDRGVRQAGFWVLHQVKMPSVLVELGFISNSAEELFLGSEIGQKKLANCIVNAFGKYKHEFDKKTTTQDKRKSNEKTEDVIEGQTETVVDKSNETSSENQEETQSANAAGIIYQIQCFSTTQKIDKNHPEYKKACKFGKITEKQVGKSYKYLCGELKSQEEANQLLKQIRTVFKDAFIVKSDK